jgi:hypothetical protein
VTVGIEIPPNQWYNAGTLFQVAAQSYLGMSVKPGDAQFRQTKWLQKPALVSIVFAAISLEAFINEAQEIADSSLKEGDSHPSQVVAFASVLNEAERSRASATLKFTLASALLSGQPFDRGAAPYQDFALLMRTRDELVHMKASGFTSLGGNRLECLPQVGGGVLRQLASRNILMDPAADDDWPDSKGDVYARLPTWIGTPAMARWSCNAAASMVNAIIVLAPESVFRRRLQSTYLDDFKLLP